MKNKESIIILKKGDKIAYQDMIEEVVGPFLSRMLPYKENIDKKFLLGGVRPTDNYFDGDADYELRIIKKSNK